MEKLINKLKVEGSSTKQMRDQFKVNNNNKHAKKS